MLGVLLELGHLLLLWQMDLLLLILLELFVLLLDLSLEAVFEADYVDELLLKFVDVVLACVFIVDSASTRICCFIDGLNLMSIVMIVESEVRQVNYTRLIHL
jgi:hypothetical protein